MTVTKYETPAGRTRWRYRLNAGADPATGKRRQPGRGGFETRREAKAAEETHVLELNGGEPVLRSGQTVEAFLSETWLPSVRARVADGTWRLYKIMVTAYVVPYIGAAKVEDVTGGDLERLYGDLGVDGKAPKTIRNVHLMVRGAYKDAVRWRLASGNPALDAAPPKVPKTPPRTWTREELHRFLDHTADDRLGALWRVLAVTGMRRSEALGLTWRYTDLEKSRIHIVGTVTSYAGHVVMSGETKTESSARAVEIDSVTVTVLREHRRRQVTDRLAWGDGYQDHGLVFAREDGTPMRPETATETFQRTAKAIHLEPIGPHGLRHTWATLALQHDVNPKIVADQLGHATAATTLDRYSHVTPSLARDAADRVAAVIDGE